MNNTNNNYDTATGINKITTPIYITLKGAGICPTSILTMESEQTYIGVISIEI